MAGKPIGPYLEFPPITRYVRHAEFSWLDLRDRFGNDPDDDRPGLCARAAKPADGSRIIVALPGPSLGGDGWESYWAPGLGCWHGRVSNGSRHFSPSPSALFGLHISLVVNALTFRQSGHCLLKDRPVYLLALFPFSAVFWWFFEYLNRFVQNWYYVGGAGMTPLQYFIMATLPFSTVLPAVTCTFEWLETRLGAAPETPEETTGYVSKNDWHGPFFCSLVRASWELAAHPDLLFPLLWIAPLLVVISTQVLVTGNTPVFRVGPGEWHRICLWGLAALLCGFFWEMWNYRSVAKWIYAIPYVNRFHYFRNASIGLCGVPAVRFGVRRGRAPGRTVGELVPQEKISRQDAKIAKGRTGMIRGFLCVLCALRERTLPHLTRSFPRSSVVLFIL